MEWLLLLIEIAALAQGLWVAKKADIFFAGVEEENQEIRKNYDREKKIGGTGDGS